MTTARATATRRDARPAAAGGRAAVRRSRLQEGHGPRHLPRGAAPTSRPSTTTSATSWGSTARCCSRRSTRCARRTRRRAQAGEGQPPRSSCGATSVDLRAPRARRRQRHRPQADSPRDERPDAGARYAGRAGGTPAPGIPRRPGRGDDRLRPRRSPRAALRRQHPGADDYLSGRIRLPTRLGFAFKPTPDNIDMAADTSPSSRWPAFTRSRRSGRHQNARVIAASRSRSVSRL